MNTTSNAYSYEKNRNMFAAAAMTGMLTDQSYCHDVASFKKIAERAFVMADLMMAEGSKE